MLIKARDSLVFGITGTIGSGKTTLAKMIRKLGIPVQSSDDVVHQLIESPKAFDQIKRYFPETIVQGFVDRRKLGAIVFSDTKAMDALENILHPLVRKEHEVFVRENQQNGSVGLDIPLLYECDYEFWFDVIIVVVCDPQVRQERVLKRPFMTEEKYKRIQKLQMSDSDKIKKADFVIDTSYGRVHTFNQLKKICEAIRKV